MRSPEHALVEAGPDPVRMARRIQHPDAAGESAGDFAVEVVEHRPLRGSQVSRDLVPPATGPSGSAVDRVMSCQPSITVYSLKPSIDRRVDQKQVGRRDMLPQKRTAPAKSSSGRFWCSRTCFHAASEPTAITVSHNAAPTSAVARRPRISQRHRSSAFMAATSRKQGSANRRVRGLSGYHWRASLTARRRHGSTAASWIKARESGLLVQT